MNLRPALFSLLLCGVVVSAQGQGKSTKSGKEVFRLRPAGEALTLAKKEKQSGDLQEGGIEWASFREVTIAQGSGEVGFNSLRVKRSGEMVVVHGSRSGKIKTWKVTLPESVVRGLVAALNEDNASAISGLYSAGVHGGTQGFVEISATHGRAYAWLDNYFEPLEKTFEFCNREMWPAAMKKKPFIGGETADGQAEYRRIFQPGR